MWIDVVKAFLAMVAFVTFPFLVIAAAAGILALSNRVGASLHHFRDHSAVTRISH
jgi:hypothetical protein